MAFTGLFSVSQTSDYTSFAVTDNSSYASEAQGTFSGRFIYVYKIDGTLLTSVSFPFTDGASKTLTGVLNTDYSLLVNVVWTSLSPQPGSVYTAQNVETFLNYLEAFLNGQISNLSDDPSILQDTNWYTDLFKLQTEIDNAEQAGADGQQFSSQAAISRAQYLVTNSSYFF